MFFKQLLQSSTVRLALIALVLCSVTLVGSRSTGEAKAAELRLSTNNLLEQSSTSSETSAPDATTAVKDYICKGSVSARFDLDALVVICGESVPGTSIFVFAVRGATSQKAKMVAAFAITASTTQVSMVIRYDDTSTNFSGCEANNCRELLWIGL